MEHVATQLPDFPASATNLGGYMVVIAFLKFFRDVILKLFGREGRTQSHLPTSARRGHRSDRS
jgi:hypothetical protein